MQRWVFSQLAPTSVFTLPSLARPQFSHLATCPGCLAMVATWDVNKVHFHALIRGEVWGSSEKSCHDRGQSLTHLIVYLSNSFLSVFILLNNLWGYWDRCFHVMLNVRWYACGHYHSSGLHGLCFTKDPLWIMSHKSDLIICYLHRRCKRHDCASGRIHTYCL